MIFKKETKHTVVYEVEHKDAPSAVRSVYVDKPFLLLHATGPGWPEAIELTVVPL